MFKHLRGIPRFKYTDRPIHERTQTVTMYWTNKYSFPMANWHWFYIGDPHWANIGPRPHWQYCHWYHIGDPYWANIGFLLVIITLVLC